MMVAVDPGIEKLFERYNSDRLTPEQVGEVLGLAAYTVRRQLRDGDLPGYQLGTGKRAPWLILKSELIAVLSSRWNQQAGAAGESVPNLAEGKE